MPPALEHLTREGHIAPVDLAQAAIGPGIEIYSRFNRVGTIAGELVTVRDALAAINDVISNYHRREQGDLDAPSRFCMEWIRAYGYRLGPFGDAEGLARAMNVSLDALIFDRLLTSERGQVQLLPPEAFNPRLPISVGEFTVWEASFRMAYHLDPKNNDGQGLVGATSVAKAMGGEAELAERLARILYEHFDASGDSRNAVKFNVLVASWPEIERALVASQQKTQGTLIVPTSW